MHARSRPYPPSVEYPLRSAVKDNRLFGLGCRGTDTSGVPTTVAVVPAQYPARPATGCSPAAYLGVCLRCPGSRSAGTGAPCTRYDTTAARHRTATQNNR